MEYGLLPTEAALSFLVIMTIVYFKKHQFKNARTYMFKSFLILTLVHGIVMFASVMLIKYIGKNFLTLMTWRFAAITMVDAWGMYYLYSIMVVNNVKETHPIKIVLSTWETKVTVIILLVVTILLFLPINIPIIDFIDPNNIYYFSKGAALLMTLGTLGCNILYSFGFIKNWKKLSKEFKFANLISLSVSLIICSLQYFIPETNWVPLCYTLVAYITYFMVENPDIIIMNETLKLQEKVNGSGKKKTEFLSNLSEDINIPINKMLEQCDEMYNEEFNSKKAKENLMMLSNEGKNVLETMNNILDASRIKTNKTFVDDRRYEVKKLLKNIIDFAQEKIDNKNIKLIVNVNTNLSSKLYGDYEKIYQILTNVISNACLNTKFGRITISMEGTRKENIETITFKIIDTGDGIPEDKKDKVFDETNDEYSGITVAKKYLDLMGGKIWFETKYKMGTKFYIKYNQKIADITPIGDLSDINEEVQINTKNDYTGYKALLVDDSPGNTKLTKKILESKKLSVEVISSGEECVKKIKAEEKIDIIFMDIMMPEMDGVETLKVLKDLEGYTLPPIIALTANALSGMKESYLSEGFDEYMSKPIEQKEIDRVLNKYFNK